MAGLFFCIASAEGAGLLFCPAAIRPHASVYSGFLYHPCSYTDHAAKQRTGLYRGFSDDCTRSTARKYQTNTSGYNAVCATLERITAPQHLQRIPDTRRNAGRYTGQHSRPIIIRYIRAYPCYGSMPDSAAYYRPYKPGGGQRLHLYRVSPAASQYLPRPAACDLAPGKPGALHPAGQSSSRGSSAAARNHWRLPPYLFSGFRPIANRGQQ